MTPTKHWQPQYPTHLDQSCFTTEPVQLMYQDPDITHPWFLSTDQARQNWPRRLSSTGWHYSVPSIQQKWKAKDDTYWTVTTITPASNTSRRELNQCSWCTSICDAAPPAAGRCGLSETRSCRLSSSTAVEARQRHPPTDCCSSSVDSEPPLQDSGPDQQPISTQH